MAGNIQADNSGNIYVEFDYNNIIVVDPNKTIDNQGKIQERLVDHEKLVMYANLEAEVLPRTKLAVGATPTDKITTISVAKIDFLKPTKNSYLGTGYYDEITGKNTTNYKGDNQMLSQAQQPIDGSKPYVIDRPADLKNIVDNGLLGITDISITTNSSFIPSVKIKLQDVQGRALFQLGNNSPYSAFFNLPYPPFFLTLKGYYGQAIRYQLNLEKFNARFNSFSGNYEVDLEFRGYKFNILNEISMGHLLALPHMYTQQFNVAQTPVGPQQTNKSAEAQAATQVGQVKNNATGTNQTMSTVYSNIGYQKMVEVYSEYKSKGLISPDFPELTLVQLMNKLQTFEQTIQNSSYFKVEVEPLTNIRTYKQGLQEYFNDIRGDYNSWFTQYINPRPLYLNDGTTRVYTFKDIEDKDKVSAIAKLKNDITTYNNSLASNPTLGINGESKIVNPINYDTIVYNIVSLSQISLEKTAINQTGIQNPSADVINQLKSQYPALTKLEVTKDDNGNFVNVRPMFFIFEGDGKFDKSIALMDSQATKKLQDYESSISAKLLKKIESGTEGLGFKPTVRNMLAVIMASAEGFLRLLDDVHTKAWSLKNDPIRKAAILNNLSSAPGSDTLDNLNVSPIALSNNSNYDTSQIPIYPWPQFFVETPEDKKGRFQLKYIGDPSVSDLTQGYLFDKWPEVEFVEEYLKGLTKKFNVPEVPDTLQNQNYTNTITVNAIEFPSAGLTYFNKEELKFFYEIWERQFLTSHYSGLIRANSNQINDLIKLNTDAEVNNIYDSINVGAPYLSLKLKNYDLNAQNYVQNLENFSNGGTGKSYQDFIRDFFVTPYIRTITENPTAILSTLELGQIPQMNSQSTALRKLLSVATNDKLIVDTLPFSNSTWCLNNLSDGVTTKDNEVYNTKNSLTVFEPRKVISNFNDVYDFKFNRPVTNFSYTNYANPTLTANNSVSNGIGLSSFYTLRTPNDFAITEGYCNYVSPVQAKLNGSITSFLTTGGLPYTKTTSLLNTPYFVNSIQKGVQGIRNGSPYPFVQAAYLFLNSLPLASLREKYKSLDNNVTSDLDFIASCFNKFGAIHKLPYAWMIKLGSIWYRYKKFKETGIDILTDVWKNFESTVNYSPVLSSATQTYEINFNSVKETIVLQSETSNVITINTGFYPQLINDYNVFFNGFELYTAYDSTNIQNSLNLGMKLFSFPDAKINGLKQGSKNLILKTWSVLLPDFTDTSAKCDPKNNTVGKEYYIVPSFGSQINQTIDECVINLNTNTPQTEVNLTNNPSMYNGSVRSIWSTPNFGYFDNNQIKMPSPDEYFNQIDPNTKNQSPFRLLTTDDYSKIEDIFGVFEKRDLDKFEQEFLNFCKPITNADTTQENAQYNVPLTNANANFRNFQSLLRSVMTVPIKPNGQTDIEYFQNTINNQNINVQNEISAFLQYDILFKNGNPSKYKRRVFDSYLSYGGAPIVTDPIPFKPYVVGTLPSKSGDVLLGQSKLQHPDAWFALETEVGFSTIPNVIYSSTGSCITDFFIDNNIEFTANNVVILAPLIKMYAARKLEIDNLTAAQFKNQLSLYLNQETQLQNNFLNLVLSGVRLKLPDQQQLPSKVFPSAISGEQSKSETYEIFKALNDKWISGDDFKTKTLFEDMLFLDRASRNIGDTILIDIFDIQNMFSEKSLNMVMSVFTFISGILIKNNFVVMNLPGYVNFYNVQDVDGTTIPQPEGSLQFANSMWGTFLDVDYRNSGPKMVCFYSGKPSQYLNLPKGNFRYRDDAFEMRRASENPLIENQQNKKDWAISNRCVGFNIDIGTRNQNIFYSFSVSQDNGVATSETINTGLNMVNNATGRNVATQNVSLFNLYKQRSYKATVTCLGNALLQPSMYFNLRHVPMFNGPYMILEVSHHIQPGNFQTTFTGVRQGIYDLPSIDNYLQSINQNLLTNLQEILHIKKDIPAITGITNNQKAADVTQKANNTLSTPNSCVSKVKPVYSTYTNTTNPIQRNLTSEQFAQKLKTLLPGNSALQAIIYSISYVKTYVKNGNTKDVGNFVGFDYNFGGISLSTDWSPTNDSFLTSYGCVNVKTSDSTPGKSEPFVAFESVDKYIKFMAARLSARVAQILDPAATPGGLPQYYVCNWPTSNVSADYYLANQSQFSEVTQTILTALDSCVTLKILQPTTSTKLKTQIKTSNSKSKTPGVTPTPSLPAPLAGNTCPPPLVVSFSPLVGNKGTIIQLNGANLNIVDTIQFVDSTNTQKVLVKPDITDITHLNDETLRFTLPVLGDGKTIVNSQIIAKSRYGNNSINTVFKYDPAYNAATASSPGGYAGNNQTATTAPNSNNTNTNPQNSGPITLLSQLDNSNNSKITNSLTVTVNPDAGAWILDKSVDMSISVFDLITTNNNTTQILNVNVTEVIKSYVNSNIFIITHDNITSLINDIVIFKTKPITPNQVVTIQFTLIANAVDKVKNPQPSKQSFNFYYSDGSTTAVQPNKKPTYPEQPLSITLIGDSTSIQGNGPEYFNIKKPAGGYITFKFNAPLFDNNNLVKKVIIGSDGVPVSSSYSSGTDTKYTYVWNINSVGKFNIVADYLPYGYKAPQNGEVLTQTVTSPPFTL
jgi:hypothetical protein